MAGGAVSRLCVATRISRYFFPIVCGHAPLSIV
jgi:hypothetical protein